MQTALRTAGAVERKGGCESLIYYSERGGLTCFFISSGSVPPPCLRAQLLSNGRTCCINVAWLELLQLPALLYSSEMWLILHHIVIMYRVTQKVSHQVFVITASKIDRFSKFLHWHNNFAIKWSLKIPAHLKCVATLPCEILSSALEY